MRLHSVRLRDYRGVDDCKVEFSETGVTVVEGPNEVGKTSIQQGLDLILANLDSSKDRKVKAAKPVGRDVGPEVEIEMSTGPYRFVYRKRWLRQNETILEVVSPRHEQLTGRAAHERAEEILGETLDRDLWAALRIEQGTELTLPGFDVPSLVTALDQAAGGAVETDEDDDLWTRIVREHDQYWTSAGRPKGDRNAKRAAVEETQSRVAELESQLVSLERDNAEISRLATESQRLEETLREYEKQASELSREWDSTEALRNNVDRLRAADSAAASKQASIAQEQQRRQELIDELESRASELKSLEDKVEKSAPALAAANTQADQTAAELKKAQAALRTAEADKRRADEDRDHHRNRIEVEQLSERYNRVIEAQERLQEAEALLESTRIDDELLGQIEQAHLALVKAEAAVASVETTALQELSMEVNGERVMLGPHEVHSTIVDDDVVLVFPDLAQIRVKAGTGSQSLAIERHGTQQALRRLCETAGVADLAAARKAAEQRKEAERQRRDALDTIERDSRDLTVDRLRSKIEALTRRIASYTAERPEEPPLPSDFDTAKQIASDAAHYTEEQGAHLYACDQAAKNASSALQEAKITESNLAGKVEIASTARKQAASSLERARSQRADSEIAAELTAAEHDALAARRALEEAEAELAAVDPESLETRLKNAQGASQRARDELRANNQEQNKLRITLSVRGEDGLHSQHTEAIGLMRHVERDCQRTEAKAEAARLLHDLFSKRRQQARQRYSGPFKERIEQLGRIVFNSSFSVDFDDSLNIVRRTLDGDTLGVEQLSAGAVEQLAVISRLACAAIVSPDSGGAPVIIDDALGWSDPERLQRMGAAFAAASEQCQVIILTCTPGRYAHIGNATTIRLPNSA